MLKDFCFKQLKIQKYWAFIILPIINIHALFLADPRYENFTHIAYANDHFPFVLLWAITCAYYLWCYTTVFMVRMKYEQKSGYCLLLAACALMIVSVCIPYGEQMPAFSRLHVNVAMCSTIAYILLFFYLLLQYHYYDPLRCAKIAPWYVTLISALSLLFILMGCVNTWMESLFVMAMGWLHVLIQAPYR